MRRLLLIPALALVLVGTPVLALQDAAPPPVGVAEVPVAPGETVAPGWQSADTPVDATLVGVTWEGDADAEFTVESQASDGTWSEATRDRRRERGRRRHAGRSPGRRAPGERQRTGVDRRGRDRGARDAHR